MFGTVGLGIYTERNRSITIPRSYLAIGFLLLSLTCHAERSRSTHQPNVNTQNKVLV